jgi:hypothetical protein
LWCCFCCFKGPTRWIILWCCTDSFNDTTGWIILN